MRKEETVRFGQNRTINILKNSVIGNPKSQIYRLFPWIFFHKKVDRSKEPVSSIFGAIKNNIVKR